MESGQQAVISCRVEGLLSVLDSVTWELSTGQPVTADMEAAAGAYTSATKSQTSTLTVKNGVNTADTTYVCAVTRGGLQARKTEVSLKVYSKSLTYARDVIFTFHYFTGMID